MEGGSLRWKQENHEKNPRNMDKGRQQILPKEGRGGADHKAQHGGGRRALSSLHYPYPPNISPQTCSAACMSAVIPVLFWSVFTPAPFFNRSLTMSSLPQVAAHMSSVIPDAVSIVSGLNPGTARARLTSRVSPSRIACFKAAERDKHQDFVGRAKSWFLGLNLFSLKYSSSSFIIHFNLSHP